MKKMLAVVLCAVMALALCAPAMAEGAVKIGVIGPMTGSAAVYGTAVADGARIAAEEVNALGGLQIEIDVQDDEHDPEKSMNAYNTTLDNGSKLIVGAVTSGPCTAVASQAYEDRVFMLTPSASSTDVIADKDNVYQVCFTDPNQGVGSADYIFNKKLSNSVAVIYNNADNYSTGIYQTFKARAAELGLNIVSVTTFTDETTDFSVQVSEAKNAGADLVFLPTYATPNSMILTQAAAMDYKPLFFGVDGMDGILAIEGFDTSLAEGVLLLSPFSADAPDEKTQKFVAKYKDRTGIIPNQFAADAYDAVYIVYDAMVAAGVTADMKCEEVCDIMIAEMQKLTYEGLTGTMTWKATGEVDKTPTAVRIENGVYVTAD